MTQPTAAPRRLGGTGPVVFPIALGGMGMSRMYGASDDEESVETLQAALDRGVTLIDTGDFYGSGHNEMLIARAIRGRREQVQLSVKFGALRDPGGGWTGVDARPVAVRNFLAYSLRRLGVEHVDIYRPARIDPRVPVEDTVGAIADMVKAGYVSHVGLSEVGPDTIRRAHAVHPIADVQIEYSLISRSPEARILPTLRELGIGLTAYGVLSRGLLAGSLPSGPDDFRAHLPRFSPDNLAANQRLVRALQSLAKQKGVTASQLAIAWVLTRGEDIVPVIGARKRGQLDDALGTLATGWSAGDIAEIERVVAANAIAGTRYGAAQMQGLDSEQTE